MVPRVAIVIPAHNEEATIAGVLLGLRRHAPKFDRIVVDDGSTDETSGVVTGLGEQLLQLPQNLGYRRALAKGLRYALDSEYDVIVSFDADGQHRPEDVPLVVGSLLGTDADVVIGSRFCNGRPYTGPFDRCVAQVFFSLLTGVLIGRRIFDTTSGFKAFRATACDAAISGPFWDFHTETLVRLTMLGYKVTETPIVVNERTTGRSMHSYVSILRYPTKTLFLTAAGMLDALRARAAARSKAALTVAEARPSRSYEVVLTASSEVSPPQPLREKIPASAESGRQS